MKSFNKLLILVCIVWILVVVVFNAFLLVPYSKEVGRPYIVEISRLQKMLAEELSKGKTVEEVFFPHEYRYLKDVILCEDEQDLFANSKNDYYVRKINDNFYRIEYSAEDDSSERQKVIFLCNSVFFGMGFLLFGVFLYLRAKIIAPFEKLQQVPYELSKGNLTLPLEEEKTKYFGKYIWGTNMLQENLKQRREKELNLYKEKKLLLLSLTHDIKTPLSVIKLNAQALQRGLYRDAEKQKEAAASISLKVDEIEKYVSEITASAKDDFLDLDTVNEEFYLESVISKLKEYYDVKLEIKKTGFQIAEYTNCLLGGDENRLLEVLQNLMENAIKYGDGQWIKVLFDKEEDCLLITVKNSGATLDKDELPKIFDSFYRGSNVKNQPGSGLGLYICRQLMHHMNGDIFVKEEADTFAVTAVVRMGGN